MIQRTVDHDLGDLGSMVGGWVDLGRRAQRHVAAAPGGR